jgi:hypothetical protein
MSRRPALLLVTASTLAAAGCGGSAGGRVTAPSAAKLAHWKAGTGIDRVLDLSSPRSDGAIVVATAGRLALFRPAGELRSFATGPGGYASPGGGEPYIALSEPKGVPGAGCKFGRDTLYVLRLKKGPGVTAVGPKGRARRFASLPATGVENGIVFDSTGRFGHRLLVTASSGSKTTVYAIDCRGRATTLTSDAPKVEGGIAVAPATFGRFAGDLIAPDENSGRVYAVGPKGHSRLVASSGLPKGGDIGVESAGFVPKHFGPGWSAFVADRLTPGNPHPGDDVVLRLDHAPLTAAGVLPGDLLVATEGGARTDAIRCGQSCAVRHVADGPARAHLEGHVVFVRTG